MGRSKGLIYVAYGEAAINQVYISLRYMKKYHPDWPCVVVSDQNLGLVRGCLPFKCIQFKDDHPGARWAKLNMNKLSPFDDTLYMDADTRARGRIDAIFDILDGGWEMAACTLSSTHIIGVMKHLIAYEDDGLAEKNATLKECGDYPFLGFQGGVMAFRDCERVRAFFDTWRDEWQRWRGQDQGALIRAYRKSPVLMFPLGSSFNGGSLVGHYHAHARRRGLKGSIA